MYGMVLKLKKLDGLYDEFIFMLIFTTRLLLFETFYLKLLLKTVNRCCSNVKEKFTWKFFLANQREIIKELKLNKLNTSKLKNIM